MNEAMTQVLCFYNEQIINMICQKYGEEPMDACRHFLFSKTYRMLRNPELEMWEFSPFGLFDMWESEQVTGNPRNSLYLRRD